VMSLLDRCLALCSVAGISEECNLFLSTNRTDMCVTHGHCSQQFCEQGAATPWRDHPTNYDTRERTG
jgi:hypothetical protein